MYKEQGGEIPLSALFVTYASGLRKKRQERSSQSCPGEKCKVNEIRHASSPPSIYYVKMFD